MIASNEDGTVACGPWKKGDPAPVGQMVRAIDNPGFAGEILGVHEDQEQPPPHGFQGRSSCPTCTCPRPADPFHGWWRIRVIRDDVERIALEFPPALEPVP